MAHQALFLSGRNGTWDVRERTLNSPPGPEQIQVRNRTVGLNPIDWKIQKHGWLVEQWPMVIGSDMAGEVEAVGADVTLFRPGDRVIAMGWATRTQDPDRAAYQERALVDQTLAAPIPASIAFTDAATLPSGILAAAGFLRDAGIHLPGAPAVSAAEQPPAPPSPPAAVLIWGAATSVGSMTVQLARAAGVTVLATASPNNHARLRDLGATAVFDYKSATVVADLQAEAARLGLSINTCIDAASLHPEASAAAIRALAGSGGASTSTHAPASLVVVLPWEFAAKGPAPEDVRVVTANVGNSVVADAPFLAWLLHEFTPSALASGAVVPHRAEVLPGGLGGIGPGLEKLKAGVSGVKLIVEV